MSIFSEMWAIFAEFWALLAEVWGGEKYPNYFGFQKTLKTPGAWLLGVFIVTIGGYLVHLIYRSVPFIARQFERAVMIISYLIMAGIICVSVVREFFFDMIAQQGSKGELNGFLTPIYEFLNAYPMGWATTIPPILFMVLVWFACSFNVGSRSHLAFSEFRMKLPRKGQLACLTLDMVLWLVFAWIVIVGGLQLVASNAANGAPVDGTDYRLMLWWFTGLVPFAFILLCGRAIGVWIDDIRRYRRGETLVETFAIGGSD